MCEFDGNETKKICGKFKRWTLFFHTNGENRIEFFIWDLFIAKVQTKKNCKIIPCENNSGSVLRQTRGKKMWLKTEW